MVFKRGNYLQSLDLIATRIEEIGFKIPDGEYLTFLVNVKRLLSFQIIGLSHTGNFNFGAAVVLMLLVGALYAI